MNAPGTLESGSRVYREIAAAIGPSAAQKLCRALGGTRLYVPPKFPKNHDVVAVIGSEAAAALACYYHGTLLMLPKAHARRERAREMVREHMAGAMITIRDIAIATDYTEAWIYALMAQIRDEGDDGQMNLFG